MAGKESDVIQKTILILDGISSQCLPIIRSLYKSGHKIAIITPYRSGSGYYSRYTHKKLIWPLLYKDETSTLAKLLDYLRVNKTDLVLGLGDKTASLLSKNQREIQQYCHVIVPDFDVFSIAADKLNTMQFCMENEIPCPKTIDGENIDIQGVESRLKFPVIVKPKIGVGSEGVYMFSDLEKLSKRIASLDEEYGPLLIQEFIPNEEQYTVEAFCNQESQVKACIVIRKARFFPVSGGTSSCSLTVDRPDIQDITISFLEKLGWVGSANLDIIYDTRDRTPKIIEINPRVGAMARVAFESGVDIALLQSQLAFDSDVQNMMEYRKGIVLRNLFLEIPWLISSSFSTIKESRPKFFSFVGSHVFYQNFRLDDPFISMGYLFSNLRKYFNPVELRKKFKKRA